MNTKQTRFVPFLYFTCTYNTHFIYEIPCISTDVLDYDVIVNQIEAKYFPWLLIRFEIMINKQLNIGSDKKSFIKFISQNRKRQYEIF